MNAEQVSQTAGAAAQFTYAETAECRPSNAFLQSLRIHAQSLARLTSFLAGDGTPSRSFESVVAELQAA